LFVVIVAKQTTSLIVDKRGNRAKPFNQPSSFTLYVLKISGFGKVFPFFPQSWGIKKPWPLLTRVSIQQLIRKD
jgi:hypothetical protein